MQARSIVRPLGASRISGFARHVTGLGQSASWGVHSVFHASLNIGTPFGLLTVGRDDDGGLPNGIMVAGRPDFLAMHLAPAMPVSVVAGLFRVPAAGLAIDLTGARSWSARLRGTTADRWSARSLAARDIAGSVTRGRAPGLLAIAGARESLARLQDAVAHNDRRAAAAAARDLIGLGPGLTPSGDDALVGIEAALHALGHPMRGFIAGCLGDIDERTTIISETYLRHAARGEFTERLHRLLVALLGGGDEALVPAIERAVAWGATSGGDCLAGVLAGLDAAAAPVAPPNPSARPASAPSGSGVGFTLARAGA